MFPQRDVSEFAFLLIRELFYRSNVITAHRATKEAARHAQPDRRTDND